MLDLAEVIIVGLAAWRITSLLARERGPVDIFVRMRELLGFTHDKDTKKVTSWPDTQFAGLIACTWCAGLWLTAIMYGVWRLEPVVVQVIAASTILIVADMWNTKD